ncbi:hypothetical protein, partial [Lysobacter capsici]|uniref:hypothetical protein n=1 Tax=Lysobacter capsici TaxID=435897 RepID=UPI00398CA82A
MVQHVLAQPLPGIAAFEHAGPPPSLRDPAAQCVAGQAGGEFATIEPHRLGLGSVFVQPRPARVAAVFVQGLGDRARQWGARAARGDQPAHQQQGAGGQA